MHQHRAVEKGGRQRPPEPVVAAVNPREQRQIPDGGRQCARELVVAQVEVLEGSAGKDGGEGPRDAVLGHVQYG